ncbi:MAG TPA: hypothetical protein VGE37_05180 [Archangium sp.]
MMRDTDHGPRSSKRNRPFQSFRVSNVERIETSGEAAVRGQVGEREVELRYVETSGEFRVHSTDGDLVEEVTRSDLRDIGPALARYQQNVPWVDSVTGHVLKAVNDAIFPTTLSDFALRSVSDLGPVYLLAGRTPREEIDLVLCKRTGDLTIMVTRGDHRAVRRPVTSQEAWDLAVALKAGDHRPLVSKMVAAARRQAHH